MSHGSTCSISWNAQVLNNSENIWLTDVGSSSEPVPMCDAGSRTGKDPMCDAGALPKPIKNDYWLGVGLGVGLVKGREALGSEADAWEERQLLSRPVSGNYDMTDMFTHMALNAVGLNGELMRQLRGTMKAIARLFPQRADLRSFSFRNKNPGALRARILREPNQPQGMGSFPAAEIPVRSGLLSNRRTDYYDVNDSPGPLQRFR
jgi:hypothetical protein